MKQVHISTPASSANLGPGFDCVGLSLDIRNEFTFRYPTEKFQVNTKGISNTEVTHPEKNLVIRSYLKTVAAHSLTDINFSLDCVNRIPFEGGMGSSASAIIAGVAAAYAIHGLNIERAEIIKDALRIETHPDNLSACLYGGLTVSYLKSDGEAVIYPIKPEKFPACYLIHPHDTVNTKESRKVLQSEIPLKEVIVNMARLSITMLSFSQGKYDYFFDSMMDNIHEPFRMNPIMEYPKLKEKFRGTGFYGWAISGSGPSVIIFCKEVTESIRRLVKIHFEERGVTYDELMPDIDYSGLVISEKPFT